MERKLASIQRISDFTPIAGKNNLIFGRVLGWTVIVRKDVFKTNELGVFMEVDSIVPKAEWSAFLAKNNYRVKPLRMTRTGTVAQGAFFPLSILPAGGEWKEGDDVTAVLGVTKWESPVFRNEPVVATLPFPADVPKTDEIRIQSMPELLNELKGKPYQITRKIDGASMTVWYDKTIHVASRNLELDEAGSHPMWLYVRNASLEEIIKNFPRVAFQGEFVGPDIQQNRMGLTSQSWVIFNLYEMDEKTYLPQNAIEQTCAEAGLPFVSVIETGQSFDYTLEEIIARAEGTDPEGHIQEGIVVRSTDLIWSDALGKPISFKVKNRSYQEG